MSCTRGDSIPPVRRAGGTPFARARVRFVLGALAVLVLVLGLAPGTALGLGTSRAGAGEPARPSLPIGWTGSPPTIDGVIEPGEWRAAAHVDGLTQASPDPGVAPTERTEVWVMTDEDTLYVAARMWDSRPEEIVAYAMQRDGDTGLDDRFGFTIDPFLDRQNGYFFQVNANGARVDSLIEGSRVEKSWDGRWYAKASRDATGWTAEIAIPYATISFDADADVWGFNMARGIRRRDEIDRWADPSRNRSVVAIGRAGNLVGMRGIRQSLGVALIPSATARRVDDLADPPPDQDDRRRHFTRFDPSLDVFYKVTPSITTALTVNTDFGETEEDDRQVNLSRFELFFPEKRDFFLQDALIFDFGGLARNGRPFFSRRIGLDDDGEPLDILAGAKVTGRVGDVKFGVLNVVLDEHDRVGRQNLLVARAAANLGESTLGAIMTHGDPEATSDNVVLGSDFVYRNTNFGDDQTLRARIWAQASYNDPHDRAAADPVAVKGLGYAFGAGISYPNDLHSWELDARVLDADFDPALGFANRVGIRQWSGGYRKRWRPQAAGIQTVDTRLAGLLITDQGRQVESGDVTFRALEIRSPVGDGIRLVYNHRYEAVDTPFANFTVPVGRYHFDEGRVRFFASLNRPVGGELLVTWGSFFDGMRLQTEGILSVRATKYVQLGTSYKLTDLRLPSGDETIHLARVRLSLFVTPDISWITLVQYDSVSDSIGVNSRFRWIIEDGRELFLVLNQGFDARDEIVATRTAPLAKLQWTFRF